MNNRTYLPGQVFKDVGDIKFIAPDVEPPRPEGNDRDGDEDIGGETPAIDSDAQTGEGFADSPAERAQDRAEDFGGEIDSGVDFLSIRAIFEHEMNGADSVAEQGNNKDDDKPAIRSPETLIVLTKFCNYSVSHNSPVGRAAATRRYYYITVRDFATNFAFQPQRGVIE